MVDRSRRRLLGGLGTFAAGAALAGIPHVAARRDDDRGLANRRVPPDGATVDPSWTTTGGSFVSVDTHQDLAVARIDGEVVGLSPSSGERRWSTDVTWTSGPERTTVTVADGVAYLQSEQQVDAFDAETGDQRWTLETGEDPAIDGWGDEAVGITDQAGNWQVVDVATGSLVAAGQVDSRNVRASRPADGSVCLAVYRDRIESRSLADGSLRWTAEDLDPVAIQRDGGTVYAGTLSHEGVAIDVETGRRRWTITNDSDDEPLVYPYTFEDATFATGYGWLAELDPSTGERRWELRPDAAEGYIFPLAVESDRVIAAGESLYVVDRSTGDTSWTREFSTDDDHWAYLDGRVYLLGDGELVGMTGEGAVRWRETVPGDAGGRDGLYTADGSIVVRQGLTLSGWSANSPPSVAIEVATADPRAGEPVELVAQVEDESGPDALTYEWQLGDGTTASGRTVTHTYEEADSYTVELAVTDEGGRTGEASRLFEVGPAPTATPSPTATPTASPTASPTDESPDGAGTGTQSSDDGQTDRSTDNGSTEGLAPGFGIGAGVLTLGSLAAWFRRRGE